MRNRRVAAARDGADRKARRPDFSIPSEAGERRVREGSHEVDPSRSVIAVPRSTDQAGPRRAPFQPPRRVEGIQNPSERNQSQSEQNQSLAERNPNPAERNPNLNSFHESRLFNGLSPILTKRRPNRAFSRACADLGPFFYSSPESSAWAAPPSPPRSSVSASPAALSREPSIRPCLPR